MTVYPLGPLNGRTTGVVSITDALITITRPLGESTSVPIDHVKQVTIEKPHWFSPTPKKRTITLHGPGGPITVLDAIGKHGDAAFSALTAATTGSVGTIPNA